MHVIARIRARLNILRYMPVIHIIVTIGNPALYIYLFLPNCFQLFNAR